MVLALWLAAGCTGPDDDDGVVPDDTDDGSSPSTGSTGLPPSTGTTGDTATTPTVPTYPDDCDPHVRVPVVGGVVDPTVLPDPHDNVYGPSPAPYAVRYSWPGTDPSTSAAFLWRTDLGTLASVVELGVAGEPTTTYEGASFLYGLVAAGVPQYRMHEVRLCQTLLPGTTYRYRVGGPAGWSPMYSFTTPGAPGTFENVRVAITGDSRGSYAEWAMVVQAAAAFDPDLYVFTGDAVTSGGNQLEWDLWYMATGDVFTGRGLVPAHGNHEALAVNWFAQVALPGNEQWYTIRYGPLEIAVLNDSSVSAEDRGTQATWLADRLGSSDAPWKIAAHHQSAYATNTRHGSNLDLRTEWAPVFDATGVDLVFNGHNHTYERSAPVFADAPAAADAGITYVVSGGAGAPLYANTLPDWFSEVANPIEHFLIVDFGPGGAHAVARDLAGNVIDEFTVPAD